MKLLLDECLPRPLGRLFPEHKCRTVQEMGWFGKSNGALLSLAEAQFDVFLTIDQGMEYEHDLTGRNIAVLLLTARSNQIEDLAPLVPAVLVALRGMRQGSFVQVPTPSAKRNP